MLTADQRKELEALEAEMRKLGVRYSTLKGFADRIAAVLANGGLTIEKRIELSWLRSEAADLRRSDRPKVNRLAGELEWAANRIEELERIVAIYEASDAQQK